MTQPFGFVPPVAIPAIGGAANAIIPTAGILGGAAAGAKAGAVLGPWGALGGGLLGGLAGGLLLPLPTNPGTLPGGLDPGLNDPEPTPEQEPQPTPIGSYPIPDPPGTEGQVKTYRIWYQRLWYQANYRTCSDGSIITPGGYWQDLGEEYWGTQATSLSLTFREGKVAYLCPSGESINDMIQTLEGLENAGTEFEREVGIVQDNFIELYTDGSTYYETPNRRTVRLNRLTIDTVEQPLPVPQPKPPTKPRPLPIPIKPLPAPEPEPAPVPVPEPEPQPAPLEVPNPGNPTAPPITIPKAPPATPQTPKRRKPGVSPVPAPIQPGTVPLPLPVPGVPTVPEPSPDPNTVPAPGPTPLPSPGPTPVPGTDPEPGETPTPGTPNIPRPTIPGVAPAPDTSRPTNPDGSIVPVPAPSPKPTPPNQHFPVSGEAPVTDGGVRPDLASIAAEVGRIEQKVARTQNNQKDIPWWLIGPILEALGALLEQDIPGTTYQLQGVCEVPDKDGKQPVAEFPVAPAKNLGAIINRLDTMDQMLQQHLAWKTPTCSSTQKFEGEFRTISFISDEVSPNGKSRLHKRFRYRSTSSLGLGDIVDHWKDFVWEAGPVCVKHVGSSWGTPQVWAASINEGKRVIHHAAGEAGIDPDQDGRWEVGGSNSSRVGMPGTMRVNQKGGYFWITARDGPTQRPQVAKT